MDSVWEPASLLLDLLRPQDGGGGGGPPPATFAEMFDQLETGAEDALPAAGSGEGEAMEEEEAEDGPQEQEQGREHRGGRDQAREE